MILRPEVSRVSSLILRAKLSLVKKVLRHGNRFAARVRRCYVSEGEKRRTGTTSALRRLVLKLYASIAVNMGKSAGRPSFIPQIGLATGSACEKSWFEFV